MHIPDGYLGPATCATLGAAMLPVWSIAGRRVQRGLAGARGSRAPALALSGAFSFVVMMFNVPAPGGTTGHAVGAAISAIALGPAAAVVCVSIALAIQALLFGDGGVLALGANCFNMAFVMPLAAYGVYQALAGGTPSVARRSFAAGVAGYVGLNLAALAAALELGLQPVIEPGYCPYGLGTTLPAMIVPHLLIGLIEASVTAGAVAWLARGALRGGEPAPAVSGRVAWAALGVLCLASPVGLLAAGSAWGEWAPNELKARLGFVPPGLARISDVWRAVLPDYALPGVRSTAAAYALSAVIGVALIAAVLLLAGRLAVRGERR